MVSIQRIELGGKEYDCLNKELEYIIILETTQNVECADLVEEIRAHHSDEKTFFVGFLRNGRFLVRAPSLKYKPDGSTDHIGKYHFTVKTNTDELSIASYSDKRWIRIPNIPYRMRGVETSSRIVHSFRKLVDIDGNIVGGWDLRWARVKVATPPRCLIPPYVPLKIMNPRREYVLMMVTIEEEDDKSEPLLIHIHPHVPSAPTGDFIIPQRENVTYLLPGMMEKFVFPSEKMRNLSYFQCTYPRNFMHIIPERTATKLKGSATQRQLPFTKGEATRGVTIHGSASRGDAKIVRSSQPVATGYDYLERIVAVPDRSMGKRPRIDNTSPNTDTEVDSGPARTTAPMLSPKFNNSYGRRLFAGSSASKRSSHEE